MKTSFTYKHYREWQILNIVVCKSLNVISKFIWFQETKIVETGKPKIVETGEGKSLLIAGVHYHYIC